jgi:hypothetical protein
MIFKRKERKPAGIGTICSIKTSVLNRMVLPLEYQESSVSYLKEIENGFITTSSLRKGRINNEIRIEDATMVYVSNSSHYKGVVEVIVLAIRRDGGQGIACRRLLDKRKTFLMRLDSLSLLHSGEIDSLSAHYSHTVKEFIGNMIRNEEIYNKPKFSWGNR